jgi:hypothetical protein
MTNAGYTEMMLGLQYLHERIPEASASTDVRLFRGVLENRRSSIQISFMHNGHDIEISYFLHECDFLGTLTNNFALDEEMLMEIGNSAFLLKSLVNHHHHHNHWKKSPSEPQPSLEDSARVVY